MANTKRRLSDRDGKMFVPMSIDGGQSDDHFIDGGKLFVILGTLIGGGLLLASIYGNYNMTFWGKVVYTIITVIIAVWIIRMFVVNERYYYKMYKKMQEYGITTPALFWNIVSVRDTDNDDGAILTYSDLKTAVIVRIERDTITGKDVGFIETHYDAISDFYKALNLAGLRMVQMNIMEQAGKDPRLLKLDELIRKAPNKNIAMLMELQTSYIRNITRVTLYESDYFLIYTNNMDQSRHIVSDVQEVLGRLLSGAFIAYNLLTTEEVIDFIKDMYGVKLFDPAEASVNVFKESMGSSASVPFNIKSIKYTDGTIKTMTIRPEPESIITQMTKKGSKNKKVASATKSDAVVSDKTVVPTTGSKNEKAQKESGKKQVVTKPNSDSKKKKNEKKPKSSLLASVKNVKAANLAQMTEDTAVEVDDIDLGIDFESANIDIYGESLDSSIDEGQKNMQSQTTPIENKSSTRDTIHQSQDKKASEKKIIEDEDEVIDL